MYPARDAGSVFRRRKGEPLNTVLEIQRLIDQAAQAETQSAGDKRITYRRAQALGALYQAMALTQIANYVEALVIEDDSEVEDALIRIRETVADTKETLRQVEQAKSAPFCCGWFSRMFRFNRAS